MTGVTGTGTLVRSIVRRDRVRITVWVLAIGLSVMGSVASFATTYPTAADRQARARLLDGSAASLFVGPSYGLDDYTYGAMTAHELLPLIAVAVALMNIFLVVGQTRAEEESGRAELVAATAVGRQASTVAALVVVSGADLLLCGLLTFGLPVSLHGLSTRGSFAFAASLAGVGFVFAGVSLIAAQLTVAARAALGAASVAMAGAYVVRAVGDMGNGVVSWLSPFGWATETRPYVDERWWTFAFPAVASVGLVGIAFRIAGRRDLGAGLLADRGGPATATPLLSSPAGLAVRLQRTSVAWWSVSLCVLGLVYGGVAQRAGQLYADVGPIEKYLARVGTASAADQYLALTTFVSALIASGYAIQSVLRLRSEESSGRGELLLATPVSRRRFVTSHLLVSAVGSALLLLSYGTGVGLTRAFRTSDAGQLPRLICVALAYTPALWVFAALTTALFGVVPRAANTTWAVLGALGFIGFLGPLLNLPGWLYDLSPVEHVPRLPVAQFTITPLLGLTAVGATLTVIGILGFGRRQAGPV